MKEACISSPAGFSYLVFYLFAFATMKLSENLPWKLLFSEG